MKKYIVIPLCILLCFTLFGCTSESFKQSGEGSGGAEVVVKTTAQQETETESESETAADTTAKDETQTSADTTAASTTQAEKKKEEQTKSSERTTESAVSCTIEIECSDILNHMDRLDDAHRAIIPSDGVILSPYSVTVTEGETVFDALMIACSDNGIKVNVRSTVYGKYIAGFNDIDEKDCGKSSGWVYYVNDSFPPKACSSYTLSDGDKVIFRYSCGK